MLSTYRPGNNFIVRNSTAADGKYQKIRLARPTNIGDYNSGMGGTDLFDQYCSYYRTMVRTKKWPTRIFSHFFMASIVDAFILYKYSHDDATLLSFITSLLEELSMGKSNDPLVKPDEEDDQTTQAQPRRKSTWLKAVDRRLTGRHFPACIVREKGGDDGRRQCVVCKKKTKFICMQCDACVCIAQPNDTSCFEIFHSLEDFSDV